MKLSLNNEYEIEDLRRQLSSMSEDFEVSMILKGREKKFELEGTLTGDEVLKLLEERCNAIHIGSQKDEMTGVQNHVYFWKRVQTIDRSEVLPVAVIMFNINDWKFFHDNFGEAESDRLIRLVAETILSEAKPEYAVGRVDGDVFGVLIPKAEEGEAENFVSLVKYGLNSVDDPVLAPSAAAGIVKKTNIYQNIADLWSDAEYNMLEDKFRIKNAPGYRERLEHGL
ncbi:MAG: diguanylate cyclase [Lachnospiraceae bacterium]|nr:diguanylate cyclase [Lachnospiraceae bacterium]